MLQCQFLNLFSMLSPAYNLENSAQTFLFFIVLGRIGRNYKKTTPEMFINQNVVGKS